VTIVKADRHEAFNQAKEYFKLQKDGVYFNIEIKRWKPRRTITQNNFFHLLCDYLGHELGMDAALVKEGIKQIYGCKIKFRDELVPKPSSMCNKFEEMSALIEGCFIEGGEQGIDMRDFIREWEKYKAEEARRQNDSKKTG